MNELPKVNVKHSMRETRLSWALAIATYKREDVLPIAVRLAVKQTLPPSEIIICDASANWTDTRAVIMNEIASEFPDIRFLYLEAQAKGIGPQRNQAIQSCKSDIVFMFDDDTFMYPNCAEEILKIYEADSEKRILGVQASDVDGHPETKRLGGITAQETEEEELGEFKIRSENMSQISLKHKFASFVNKELLMNDVTVRFVTYSLRGYPVYEIPDALSALDINPVFLMAGFKMTFRRDAIASVQFDAAMISVGIEDLDASYRVSLNGPLVNANAAFVHHFWAESGRDSRKKRTIQSHHSSIKNY